ncbi:response regulator [Palleronia abyssalis]|uniref:KDP operon transcriptional regulatory protein KdpE n=1 Tax=Palleronia abyssalis TaxID=1501240 RepID=A0A2R8BYA9_9RHOB|nr:response regulator [Palleronia abyssalis]SPJ25168.1 KDP operon transcriptional regulatory protein KdpE [Palleronia abyssalis]
MTDLSEYQFAPKPTADRPLLGQTILVVEDSRHAGEAMRLMCMKGGARIRRADCLKSASRHLVSYRPTVVIVDLGLPDGSGLGLIRQLATTTPRLAVILAVSGDPGLEQSAMDAGADGFVAKPFGTVAAFHAAILHLLPPEIRPNGPRPVMNTEVHPDQSALRGDFALISHLLDPDADEATLGYALGFARSLGRLVGDTELADAANQLERTLENRGAYRSDLSHLAAIAQNRVGAAGKVAIRG